jgi:integrase
MALRRTVKSRKLNPGVYARPDGKYQAHIPIPHDVRFAYGHSKVVRSLKTDDPEEANRRHAEMMSQYNAGFDLLRRGTASKAFERFAVRLHESQLDVIRGRADTISFKGGANHYLSPTWRERLDSSDPEELAATVGWAADWFYSEQLGLDPDNLPRELRESRTYRQVLRECAEVLKDSWHAGTEAAAGSAISPPRYPALKPKVDESADGNRALDDRGTLPLSRYCKEVFLPSKASDVRAGTIYDRQLAVDIFTKLIGDPPVYLLTLAQITDFQEKLRFLPDGRTITGPLKDTPLKELVELQAAGTLKLKRTAAATINKHVSGVCTLLAHAHRKGHVRMNPALRMEGVRPTDDNPETIKRAFTRSEIETIFRLPIYAGCQADTERGVYQPGILKIRDERFWIPILLFLTGARASEVAGLEKSDVKIADGAARIVFRYSALRDLKNRESERVIPLHPWALKMGFAQYLGSLSEGTPYLFPNIVKEGRNPKTGELDETSLAGTSVLRQFNRTLLKHVGLAADPSATLHSFRHTFEDAMTGHDIPEEVMFRLTGRTVAGSRRTYTKSLPHGEEARDRRAEDYMRHVRRIDFGNTDLSHLFVSADDSK